MKESKVMVVIQKLYSLFMFSDMIKNEISNMTV